jgi:hypothetical protein
MGNIVNIRISEGHAPLPLTLKVEPFRIFRASKFCKMAKDNPLSLPGN